MLHRLQLDQAFLPSNPSGRGSPSVQGKGGEAERGEGEEEGVLEANGEDKALQKVKELVNFVRYPGELLEDGTKRRPTVMAAVAVAAAAFELRFRFFPLLLFPLLLFLCIAVLLVLVDPVLVVLLLFLPFLLLSYNQ